MVVADAERCKAAALTFLGRHAEAVALAERVLARQPRATATLRVVGLVHARAGNNERAAEIGARLLEINPALRASALRDYVPYCRPEDVALYVDALRRCGIPE
jgi:tetratricopeptide (TPR) repeat protein